MMNITITCPGCGSAIHILPEDHNKIAECEICKHQVQCKFNPDHKNNFIRDCVLCERKDFYKQKDFNRKIGVILFVIAAILSIWTYGLSLLALYLVDLFLFKKLKPIVICYKCLTIYRDAQNINEIHDFDHEMNDRIVYSDQDFKGKPLSH